MSQPYGRFHSSFLLLQLIELHQELLDLGSVEANLSPDSSSKCQGYAVQPPTWNVSSHSTS